MELITRVKYCVFFLKYILTRSLITMLEGAYVDFKRRGRLYLVPIFICVVVIGFTMELLFHESIRISNLCLLTSNNISNQLCRTGDPPLVTEATTSKSTTPNILDTDSQSEHSPTDIVPNTPASLEAQLWEDDTLLNLKNFTWIMKSSNICEVGSPDKEKLVMPVLVHSARQHFGERDIIRKSIGSLPTYKQWMIRFVFLLGEQDRGENPRIDQGPFEEREKQLKEEQEKYGDLVIGGGFKDSYHNLTYKHMMGYKWILNFCPEASFVMKIDDDMFVDIIEWLKWRGSDLEKKEGKIPDLYCHMLKGGKPIHNKRKRGHASPAVIYPDYCSGWAYGITVDLIKKLYSVTKDVDFFWKDDVFATGILLETTKRKFKFQPEVKDIGSNVTSSNTTEYSSSCRNGSTEAKWEYPSVAYIPQGNNFEQDMMCMWKKALSGHGLNHE